MVFISGCSGRDDSQVSIQPTVQPAEKTSDSARQSSNMPQSFYIGNLEVFPRFETGKDLNTKATVTNIGNATDPEYKVEAFVGNKGTENFEAPITFGCFLAMSKEAEIAAKKQGINTHIILPAPLNTIGATIEPGYGMDFTFRSGKNTTALIKENGGYLRFNLMIIDDNEKTGLKVFTIDDLPTIMDTSAGKAQLAPGESVEIPLSKAGVDF